MLVGSPLLSEYCSGSFAFSARQGSFSSCIIGGILFLSLMHFIVMPRGCMEPYSWHQTTLKFFHSPVEHSWYLPNDWIFCSLLWPAGELQKCSRRKMTTYSGLSLGHLLLLYQKSGQSEQCREGRCGTKDQDASFLLENKSCSMDFHFYHANIYIGHRYSMPGYGILFRTRAHPPRAWLPTRRSEARDFFLLTRGRFSSVPSCRRAHVSERLCSRRVDPSQPVLPARARGVAVPSLFWPTRTCLHPCCRDALGITPWTLFLKSQ